MRNGKLLNTLTSADNVEIAKCGGNILEVFEGFFCLKGMQYIPYTDFVSDMFEERDSFKAERRRLLQT